jgi:NAD(P)-dependent dehydrogenase (short-subunit alcohol dehydrogenase family)
MNLGLGGKTALVTGGSKGIGLAAARGLAAEGARVMIAARDGTVLARAAKDIEATTGQRVETAPVDLSTLEGVRGLVADALARLGRLDILVNNAGAIKGGDFLTTPDEEWMRGWSLKLLGYIRMARETLPAMRRQGRGPHHQRGGRGRPQSRADLHDGRRRQRRAHQLHQGARRSRRARRRAGHRRVAGAGEDGAVGCAAQAASGGRGRGRVRI